MFSKKHFLKFNFNPAFLKRSNTICKCSKWFLNITKYMFKSSRYTTMKFYRIFSIISFQLLNIRRLPVHCISQKALLKTGIYHTYWIMKVIFFQSLGSTSTCQYLLARFDNVYQVTFLNVLSIGMVTVTIIDQLWSVITMTNTGQSKTSDRRFNWWFDWSFD